MKPRLRRLAKIIAALTLLLPAAPAGAQQVTGSAVLHRDTIVEGQTRAFQISEIPTRPEYYLHASLGGAFTAEAGDVTITTNNLLGQALPVAPDSDGPRAYPDAIYGQIRFEVTANADSDGADDETFGVRLCTTANCSGGTVLGEWTVTIAEPEAETSVSGATGATVTILGGGSRLTMMESSANNDTRDRQATLRITLAASPTADLVLVARTLDTVATGPDQDGSPTSRPTARGVGPNSPDAPEFDVEVARWSSGATGADLTREAVFYANDNVVDAAGGVHNGNFSFRLLQVNHATSTDGSSGNGAVYAGVIIPDVPYSVIDDEPTRVRVLPLGTPDNEATEGSANDTAKFRVRIDRALAGSEELNVPLRFTGATLGTEFMIALDGSPSGASLNATTGVLTFSGAGAREATIVVTAASDDGNTVAESLRVNIPQYSDPWHERHFDTNLAGGACSGVACPNYDSGEGGQRGYRMTLVEAGPGLVIIDTGDGLLEENETYAYSVRLNTAPSNDVTVTISHSAERKVSFDTRIGTTTQDTTTLTFTTGNWQNPQTVRVHGNHPNRLSDTDEPNFDVTLTHDISSSDSTYNALADVTHTLRYLDDDPTEVSLSGTGVRSSPSGSEISKVMLEGDATRVDRSLTVTLSRALVAGEVARIPLILHAEGHSTADGDCDTSGDGAPSERIQHCSIVEGLRGPRISANVAWPLHHNDFVMAATGTGVRIEGVNRFTPNYRGYRILEFRGAGAQTATFALHARDGFNDGDTFDEEISIRPLTRDEIAALFGTRFHAGIDTEPATPGAAAWFGIDDDAPPEGDGILVPGNWPLLPPGLNAGDKFRLLYVTNSETAAATRDIAHYDSFVRAEITGMGLKAGGVNELKTHANSFRAIASTADPDSQGNVRKDATYLQAAEHAMFAPYPPWRDEHPDEPIYWVGGGKIADNNRDFVDNDGWDSESPRYADGTAATVHTDGYWTGTHSKGGLHGSKSLETERTGQPTYCDAGRVSAVGGDELLVMGSTLVHVGYLGGSGNQKPLGNLVNDASVGTTASHQACTGAPNSEMRPMYALSGVFAVGSGGVTIENASAAEGSAITFTVTLPGDYTNSAGVTVPYTLADGRGVTGDPAYVVATGADYTSTAGSVAIPANSSSATFSVATAQDSTYESDHYFTVTLGTPTSTGTPPSLSASNSSAIGIIEDGDDAPTVQFDPASVNASEEAGAATLTVTRTGATLVPSSVAWTTADGTAAHPGDYTSATGTVAFGASEASGTITVGIVADSFSESVETFSVQLSQPADAKLGSSATATVSVTDDDDVAPPPTVPTVQFRDTALLVYEADPLEFPYIAGVLLDASEAVAADTVVGFTIGGTATNPDFAILDATSGTSETILAGEDEATFNIRVLNDNDHEPDETVILTLVDGDGYDLGEQTTLTVTIRDTPDMEFATAMSEALEGATATVTINASHAFTEAADVAFTLGGTATAADYTAPTSPVRFSVGATTATIGIPIAADMDSETGETIILTLTDDNGYDLGAQATHTITTEDNEALLPLTVRFTASGSRVLESAGTATVTVEASRPASEDTDVAFTVTHPSQNAATAGTDYTTPTSPVTIASGQTTATIRIPILDDNDDCTEQGGVYSCPDDGEKFILTLTDGADYDLADTNTRHTVTIFEDPVENDEGEVVAGGLATINLTRPRLHLTEGGPSVQYGISLTRNPMANVDLYVTSPDIGLFTVAGADGVRYQQIALRFTRRNWAAPQFVTVQAVQDDDRDSEQNMLIGHAIRGTQADSVNFEFGSPYFSHNRGGTGDDSGDDIGVALPDLPVYITDDDAAPNEGLTLEYVDADAARPIVIEEGKAATLRLRWSRALTAGETASARLTITGGAHGEDKDYQVTTDTPDVTVEALPVGVTKTEFIVTWAKAATNAAADVKIKTRNDGKRGAGERHLAVELLDAFSADGSAGQNDTPSGVRLKDGPQEERIHVLSRDRLVVRQTTPDGFVFNGLEAAGDEAELTTDNAWTEIDEDGAVTHKVKVSLSRPPTNTGDVVVTVSTSDSDKLSVAGSDDGDGVADTITWVSSGSGTQYRESVTVEFTAEEDGDSDSEVVFVYFTMTSGYGNAHPPGTLVRAFRVDIKDDDGGVIVVPTSLTLTEGANRGEGVPGSEPARRTHQIAVRLNTDPGDGSTVVLTPSVYDVKNTNILSTKVERDKRRLRFTGGASGNWDEYQLIGFSAKADSDSDDDEFFLRWDVSNYPGVTGADIPAVTIQVKDNDPAVRISESELDLVEGASAGSGGARTYDVVLNAPPAAGEVVTVTPTSSDAGAVSFDASSAAATTGRPPRFGVSNWDTPQRVTVYAAADGDADDETATITHSVSGGDNYGSVAAPSIAVNVLDKDGPEGIVLSADSVRVEEGGHPVSFTVRLAGRPTGPVSLNVTGAGSAVSADTDLSTDGAQTTLEFTQQNWHRPKTVWLSAEDESDPTDTDDESVTLMVGGTGAPYAALPVAVTVLDDEFTGPTFTVTGSGTLTEGVLAAAIFTVSADIALAGALPVTLNISETADFVAAANEGDQTLAFSSSRALIRHSVPIDDDNFAEDDGSITATLKPGAGYRVGTPSSATINVMDDPNDTTAATPELTFGSANYSVAEDSGRVSVTVNAAPAPGNALTVNLSSAPGTAGRRDYTPPAATFTFPAREMSHTFSVAITDDGVHEDDETFTLTLQAAQDASYTLGSPATATVTITNDDPRPPPIVSVHPKDAVGEEAASNSASVELRLSRALESGETLSVDYRIDLNAGANESDDGVTLTHAPGDPSTGTLTIAGPSAPQDITLELSPAANTVDASVSGSRAAEFRLTGVSGVDGAGAVPGADSTKVFVNDSQVERRTSIQVSGGSALGRRQFGEGEELWILLDGKAGRKQDGGGLRTHDGYNVVIGVQHLTTNFDDLGAAYEGHDAFVGHLRREGDTDYYNVGVLGYGHSAQVRIPISDDAASESDERFRVFIAETPGTISNPNVIPNKGVRTSYMGVRGTYNSLVAAPGIDFTIKGQPGGGQQDEQPQSEPPPAPTEAVSNLRVTAVDANNAKVTWDAVEHATSYDVEYETTSALADPSNHVQGAAFGWTDTEWTFQHDAAEAMTLTVTVTPAYEDEYGDTQVLDNLAGAATIDVAPAGSDSIGNGGSTDTTLQQPDYSALKAKIQGYADEQASDSDHAQRWMRVLAALGDADAIAAGHDPMTASEAQGYADRGWSRWDEVVDALTEVESRQTAEPEPEPEPDPVTIGACVSLSQWKTVKGYYDSNAYRSPNYGANWYRVLIAYHEDRGDQTMPDWVGATSKPSSAYTVEEAERSETVWSGWTPVRKVLQCLEKESGQSFAPLLPSSSNSAHEGVVRFVNASPQGGSVHIQATDDSGWSPPPVTLQVGPGESVHLTTGDLEQGNAAKGLSGYLGAATGDWRLDVSSERDIEVLPYVRAHDGVLAPMHAVAEAERGVHRVSTFAPANDPGAPGRTGLLRLVNRGDEALTARIAGTDDSGAPGGEVSLDIPAREAVLLTAAELEGGASGLRGALGDGRGMWRLSIASDGDLAAMSLLRSGGGHLTNLSGGASPAARSSEVHAVPYFPSASDPLGRQGLVRIVNDTASRAMVRVQPHDDAGRRYEPLTLALGAGEAAHLNSWDLETGNASGGLSGRTGSGTGDWRLDIAGPPGVEVLAYVRAPTGSLMPVHDVADAAELETGQGIGGALMPSASGSSRSVSPGWMGSRMPNLGLDVQ